MERASVCIYVYVWREEECTSVHIRTCMYIYINESTVYLGFHAVN